MIILLRDLHIFRLYWVYIINHAYKSQINIIILFLQLTECRNQFVDTLISIYTTYISKNETIFKYSILFP